MRINVGVDTDARPPGGLFSAGTSAEIRIILNGSRLLFVGEVGRFGTC